MGAVTLVPTSGPPSGKGVTHRVPPPWTLRSPTSREFAQPLDTPSPGLDASPLFSPNVHPTPHHPTEDSTRTQIPRVSLTSLWASVTRRPGAEGSRKQSKCGQCSASWGGDHGDGGQATGTDHGDRLGQGHVDRGEALGDRLGQGHGDGGRPRGWGQAGTGPWGWGQATGTGSRAMGTGWDRPWGQCPERTQTPCGGATPRRKSHRLRGLLEPLAGKHQSSFGGEDGVLEGARAVKASVLGAQREARPEPPQALFIYSVVPSRLVVHPFHQHRQPLRCRPTGRSSAQTLGALVGALGTPACSTVPVLGSGLPGNCFRD